MAAEVSSAPRQAPWMTEAATAIVCDADGQPVRAPSRAVASRFVQVSPLARPAAATPSSRNPSLQPFLWAPLAAAECRVFASSQAAFSKTSIVQGNTKVVSACVIGPRAIVRGDIAQVSFGTFVFIGESAVIKPPMAVVARPVGQAGGSTTTTVEPLKVQYGDYVAVGKDSVVEALHVGSCVVLEEGCVVGSRSVIGDAVWFRAGSVVPPGATIAPFGVYAGNPCLRVAELHPDACLFDIREVVCELVVRTAPFLFSTGES